VRRNRHRFVAGLTHVGNYLEAFTAQLFDDLRVMHHGAEADQAAALAHGLFHHLDRPAHAEAETHLTGTQDLHVYSPAQLGAVAPASVVGLFP
jgi:hypothetical protein